MSNDAKFFMFICTCVAIIAISCTAGVAYSNYLYTVRMKECVTAGYEWIHLPNFSDMECRKVNK